MNSVVAEPTMPAVKVFANVSSPTHSASRPSAVVGVAPSTWKRAIKVIGRPLVCLSVAFDVGSRLDGRLVGRPGRWRRLLVDAGLAPLRHGDRRRRAGERVSAGRRLRERDDVADRLGAGDVLADPVPAERDPAVRRRPVLERLEQEAELALRLLLRQSEDAEDALLQFAFVDTQRATADLAAVQDDVVGDRQRLAWRVDQRLLVFRAW